MFANKRVLVTGSGSGIGRGIALAFAREKAEVIVTGRRESEIEKTVSLIHSEGGKAVCGPMDIRNPESIDSFFEDFVKLGGGLDVLVNNAGINITAPLLDSSWQEVNDIITTNLTGAAWCIRAAARLMKEQNRGGSIIAITSDCAHAPLPRQTIYSASKAGLNSIVKTLAVEFKDYGIRINAVAPGPVESPMTVLTKELEESAKRNIPLGRIGQPNDVANAVLFLASDAAEYITGASLTVDGGSSLRRR